MPVLSANHLAFIQITLGAALVALGYHDFTTAERPDRAPPTGLGARLVELEELVVSRLAPASQVHYRRAIAALFFFSGLGIAASALLG